MQLYAIIGAGGFGREVMPLADIMLRAHLQHSDYQLVFVTEEKSEEGFINNYMLMTLDEYFSHPAENKFFNIAISHYEIRKRIAERMLIAGSKPFQINAMNRIELSNNIIDEGAIFCAFTTVTSNTKIGKFFHANIYSYIAHDCIIGDYVTFAPNVQCNGNVIIEDDAYVGTGVIIKQGTAKQPMIIGKGAILGMGAVITKNVAPFATVVGNPAKPLVRQSSVGSPAHYRNELR